MKTITTALAVVGTMMVSGVALASHPPGLAVTFEMQEALERYDFARSAAPNLTVRQILPRARERTVTRQLQIGQDPRNRYFDHESFSHGGQ